MNKRFPDNLLVAAGEYKWMLSKGYPQKASLKLVGDKHMLAGEMRQVLYRGICSEVQALEKRFPKACFPAGADAKWGSFYPEI